MREDIVTSVHRIQATGIEVMAGMIVGFDNDDPSIFEEQSRFIQQARIPISMTGMLNAVPKTPLHARLKALDDSSPTRLVTSSCSRTSSRAECPGSSCMSVAGSLIATVGDSNVMRDQLDDTAAMQS
jgi:hypothetical protein